MTIYHGSTQPINAPKIIQSTRTLDFGAGFYTTSSKTQAISWARIVSARRNTATCYLSIYNFNCEAAKQALIIKNFDAPNEGWLNFVCSNRRGEIIAAPYDIAMGPVANDKVYSVVQFYENGVYTVEETISRLKVNKLFDQILFHTEKSLKYCSFIGSELL